MVGHEGLDHQITFSPAVGLKIDPPLQDNGNNDGSTILVHECIT